jgi:hypothetical protein
MISTSTSLKRKEKVQKKIDAIYGNFQWKHFIEAFHGSLS